MADQAHRPRTGPALARSVLAFTVIENLASALVELGVYFYTDEVLGFTAVENLLLAGLFGVLYVGGALVSHGLSRRWGERRLLVAVMWVTIVSHLLLALQASLLVDFGVGEGVARWVMVAVFAVWAVSIGLKWPIVESFMAAGLPPRGSARAVGRFNLAWSAAVAPAVAVTGLLIALWPPLLFLTPIAANLVAVWLVRRWPDRPAPLAHDHPERPDAATVAWYGRLLAAGRWQNFAAYALLFVISPLFPSIFAALGVGVVAAAALSSLVHVVRFAAFAVLHVWTGWHGRGAVLFSAALLLPVGALLILLGGSLSAVLIGQVVFGWAAGAAYFAALYYGMVVSDGSVEGGGHHEAIIGAGFAVGPAVGLASLWLAPVLGSVALGTLVGLSPVLLAASVGGLWPILRRR